jgi:hypothetical protein
MDVAAFARMRTLLTACSQFVLFTPWLSIIIKEATTEVTAMKKTATSKNSARRKTRKKIKQEFPTGWNERKVRAVIRHYDRLTDDELAREIETALEATEETLISVPTELLPAIRNLIVRHQQSA